MLVLQSDKLIDDHVVDMRAKEIIGKDRPHYGYVPARADPDRKYYRESQAYYRTLGIDLSVYFDLDREYDHSKLDSLLECDALHLSGGNTYYFMRNVRRREFGKILVQYLAGGGVIIGTSAGAILLTTSISTATLCGDDNTCGPLEGEGLHLVDFDFVPHLDLGANSIPAMQEYSLRSPGRKIFGCCDGAGIIVHNKGVEFMGTVVMAYSGQIIEISR